MNTATLRRREMFVPLVHAPGTAQADFGEALVIVGGEERKAHYFVIDLGDEAGLSRVLSPGAVSIESFELSPYGQDIRPV